MKEYKLTISILASNRKDTLPKTLESIKPILEKVSSELIVTDTGCDEELLSYIGQYTQKIIKFNWCNDFSKARNVGLKEAKGEWFLFLDDDEWFEDVHEIIDFFNSGDCDNYDKIEYLQRNYHTMEGVSWTDNPVDRGARITEGIQFVDAIHEHLNTVGGRIKRFSSCVHHYGYVFKTDEEKRKHIERNLTLLKQQSEERSNDCRTYAHIIQEYIGTDDYEEILKWSDRALDKTDYFNINNYRYIGAFYCMNVYAKIKLGQAECAVNTAKNVLELEYISGLSKGMTYYLICTMQGDRGIEEHICTDRKLVSYVNGYLTLRKYYMENPQKLYDESTIYIKHAFDDDKVADMLRIGRKLAEKYAG